MATMLGYSLLFLSCIAWALLLLVPLSPVSTEQKLAWGAGLYIFGQVTWFVCLPLLGREFIGRGRRSWRRVKDWLRRGRARK
jgi:hypothetical protein